MFLLFVISCLVGLALIASTYILKSRGLIKNETARKLIHFAHALVIAGWPIFIGYWLVILAEIAFLAVVILADEYKLFHSLRRIGRKTWGEIFYPLGVIILALLTPPTWLFVAAIMLLGLADAAAALVGKRFKGMSYVIYGHTKTVAGSSAFFVVAAIVMTITMFLSPVDISTVRVWQAIILIPLITTIVENVSPWGSDNLTVPITVYVGAVGLGLITF